MKRTNSQIDAVLNHQGKSEDFVATADTIEYLKFNQFRANDLNPVDFFDPETIYRGLHQVPYLNREKVDEQVLHILKEGGNLIISGRSGAGKSRLLFEAFSTWTEEFTVLLPCISTKLVKNEGAVPEMIDSDGIVRLVSNEIGRKFCLLIDDIGQYEGFKDLFSLIEKLCPLPNLIIILSGKEEELDHFPGLMEILPHWPAFNFTHFTIPDLTTEQIGNFSQQYLSSMNEKVTLNRDFDKTIGAIFRNSSLFSNYYHKLAYDSYERLILWSLKCVHFLTGRSTFKRTLVVNFALLQQRHKQQNTFVYEREVKLVNDAIDSLIDHSFLFLDDDAIFIPPYFLTLIAKGYLFDVLRSNNMPLEAKRKEEEIYLVEDILSLFKTSSNELKKIIINQLIQRSEWPASRKLIAANLSKGLRGGLELYNGLIARSKKLEEAENWDTARADARIKPNLDTLLAFAKFFNEFSEIRKKEQDLKIEGISTSKELCKEYLVRAKSAEDAETIAASFTSQTLGEVHQYYYHELIKRLNNFTEGYRVYKIIPKVPTAISPYLYKSLIQLDGGSFELAFELYLEFQEKYIEMTDFSTLLALAKKAKQLDEADKILSDLKMLPEKEVDNTIFTTLLEKFKKYLSAQARNKKTQTSLARKNNLQYYHQLLLLPDIERDDRSDTLDKIIALGQLEVESFELFFDHPSVTFQTAMIYYNRMKSLGVCPSFKLFEIILEKYRLVKKPTKETSEEVLDLYEDIKDLLDFKSAKDFKKLFLLLYLVFQDFDAKIELFELAIAAKLNVENNISLLYKEGRTYLDAAKILEIFYAAKLQPAPGDCLQLFKMFLPKGVGKENREELILFFKDLKNCRVDDAILSRVYLSLINLKDSRVPPITFIDDLKNIGISLSPEVLIEAIIMEIPPQNVSPGSLKLAIEEYFSEDEITEIVVEGLVLRYSNFLSAYSVLKAINTDKKNIALVTYKKLLEYAIHASNPEYVRQVLEDVLEKNYVEYIVPLLSKLEGKKRFESCVALFINSAELNPDLFKRPQDKKYWLNALEKAKIMVGQKKVIADELIALLETGQDLDDAFFACTNFMNTKTSINEIRVIKRLLEIASSKQVLRVYEFCRAFNLNYLDDDIVCEFILNCGDEEIRQKVFTEFEKKCAKENIAPLDYYRKIIYPFYCYLSVAAHFKFPFDFLVKISKKNENISPVVLDCFSSLIQHPKDVDLFIKMCKEYKISVKEEILDRLIEVQAPNKVWKLLSLYQKEIKGFGSEVYNTLLQIYANKGVKDLNDFKSLFLKKENIKKYPVISKFMLSSGLTFDQELFSILSEDKVTFELLAKIFSIFESQEVEFPFSLFEKKINQMNDHLAKKGKKMSVSDRARLYKSLVPLIRIEKSMSELIPKLIHYGVDSKVIFSLIERESDFTKKINICERFPSISVGENTLLNIIASIRNIEEYKLFLEQFPENKRPKDGNTVINSKLIEKKFKLILGSH